MVDIQLMDPPAIAALLCVKPRTVRDKYAKMDGFPDPIYLPAGEGGCSRKRWKKTDIMDWIERMNRAHGV